MADNANDYEKLNNGKVTESQIAKCPSCGSNLTFDPKKQALLCSHCGHVEAFDTDKNVKELDINEGFEKGEKWSAETNVYHCDNCGTNFVLDKNATASCCPFCGTAHVIVTDEIKGLKPNVVIPFLIDVKTALENTMLWVKRRLFAPASFKKSFKGGKFNGVYYPAFTFDSNTSSVYYGRLGIRHTRTVGSGENKRTETYIEWFNVSGNYEMFFDDITITSGKKFTQNEYNKAQPFNTAESRVYESKYLLGYSAYHYDKGIDTCWQEARAEMDARIRRGILSQYYYDVVDFLNVSTSHKGVTYKYELLPIYTMSYEYHQKTYGVYVNGSTGKVNGKCPVSPWRVLVAVGIGLLIVGGIAALVLLNQK